MNDLKGIIEDVNKSDLVSKNVLEEIIRLIGQETWQSLNDIHSDIITTSGEVAITLRNLERLEEENEQLKQQLTKGRDILFEFVKIACETFSEGCPECDYCFLGEVKQKTEVLKKVGVGVAPTIHKSTSKNLKSTYPITRLSVSPTFNKSSISKSEIKSIHDRLNKVSKQIEKLTSKCDEQDKRFYKIALAIQEIAKQVVTL